MAFGNATKGYVKKHSGGGGGGGTTNYNDLSNKPSINGVTLSGNKTSEDLGISGGGVLSLHESTMTSDSTYTYYSIPKTAKLVTLATCHSSFNNYRRTPEVINIETIKNCANSNGTMKLFLLLPGASGVDTFEVSVEDSNDNYILKYDYSSGSYRLREVYYI